MFFISSWFSRQTFFERVQDIEAALHPTHKQQTANSLFLLAAASISISISSKSTTTTTKRRRVDCLDIYNWKSISNINNSLYHLI